MAVDSPIRLVCLDLGGVVVRICRSWPEACAAAGLEDRTCACSHDQLLRAWRILGADLQLGKIDARTFAEQFSQAVGGLYSTEEIDTVNGAWVLGEYEGMGELIDQLHGAGLDTAALSNTSAEHWLDLVKMPAISRLKHRIGSHQLGLVKPDPAIYHSLEEQTGFCGPEVVFFDDLQENVEAASKLGWLAEQIDPLGSPPEQIRAVLHAHGVMVSG